MGEQLARAVVPMYFEDYVFDLYGTLVDIRTDESLPELWEKLALFYGYYGAAYTAQELRERYGELVNQAEQAMRQEDAPRYAHEASPEIELTPVFAALFAEKGVEADRALAVHAGQFFRILSTDHVTVYPGTKQLLRRLREAGKRVFLLSNAQRIFTEYEMRSLGLEAYFDDILISSDYGMKKPDSRFFRLLMNRHSLNPERTLFVGNDSRTDIGGARQAGMRTFYVGSSISPVGDRGDMADYFVNDFTRWEEG